MCDDEGTPVRTDGLQPWRLSFVPPKHLRLSGFAYPDCEDSPATPPRAAAPPPQAHAPSPPSVTAPLPLLPRAQPTARAAYESSAAEAALRKLCLDADSALKAQAAAMKAQGAQDFLCVAHRSRSCCVPGAFGLEPRALNAPQMH